MSQPIRLRASTRISLNDRFKLIRQNVGGGNLDARPTSSKTNLRQGSIRNKRLALQMANRPSVQAALKIKNRSIKQRLGSVKQRLGVVKGRPIKRNQPLRNKINDTKVVGLRTNKFRLNRNNFTGGNRSSPRGKQQMTGTRRPFIRRQPNRSQVQQAQQPSTSFGNQRQLRNGRLNLRNKITPATRKQMIIKGQKFVGKFNQNKQFNNNRNTNTRRNMNARGNGRRNPNSGKRVNFAGKQKFGAKNQQWQNKRNVNKDQLDKDLDAYMAKTKTNLDSDLDAYMGSVN